MVKVLIKKLDPEVKILYKNKKINDEKLYMKKKSEIAEEIVDRVVNQLN